MKLFKIASLTLALMAVTACSTEETESEYIKTEGIWADIKIESDGTRSRVVTELNVGGSNGTNVSLSNEDKLVATANGQSKTLQRDTDFLDIDYQEYFDITSDNSVFKISLNRKKETDASDSHVELPLNFDIHTPSNSDNFGVNQIITLHWDSLSADKSIELNLHSDCTANDGTTISAYETLDTPDDGLYAINLSVLNMFKNNSLDKSKNCDLDLKLTRKNHGEIDARFHNGSRITASQIRKVKDLNINI